MLRLKRRRVVGLTTIRLSELFSPGVPAHAGHVAGESSPGSNISLPTVSPLISRQAHSVFGKRRRVLRTPGLHGEIGKPPVFSNRPGDREGVCAAWQIAGCARPL